MKKTVVKALIVLVGLLIWLSLLLYPVWNKIFMVALFPAFVVMFLISGLGFVVYYFDKRAYTYYVTGKSVRIVKSWVFGTYERELTLDQIIDAHINQGFLARLFNCGSLGFVSTAGLEVAYKHSGVGIGGGMIFGGAGTSAPSLLKGRANTFWDVPNPVSVKEVLLNKIAQWRDVVQEKRMADTIEKITEKMPSVTQSVSSSLAGALERLNTLYEKGALSKDEYEKAKKKLLS